MASLVLFDLDLIVEELGLEVAYSSTLLSRLTCSFDSLYNMYKAKDIVVLFYQKLK